MSYKFIKYNIITSNKITAFKVYKDNLPSLSVAKDAIKYLYNIIIDDSDNTYGFNTMFNTDIFNFNNTYDIIECIEFESKELILKYISENYIEEFL